MDKSGLLAELSHYERSIWEALAQGDAKADAALLDETFLGAYPEGFANRADHVSQLEAGPSVASYELAEIKVVELGNNNAMLCYRATFLRTDSSQTESMYVSSIWHCDGTVWRNIFSQDTPAAT